MEMNDVTVGIKSFFRPKRLELSLKSLLENSYEFKEVIIADDGEVSEEKQEIYEKFEDKLPLKVIDLEFDYGLAASRNEIVREMEGDYLLLIDDDMTVPSNVDLLKRILEKDESLGAAAGMLYENGEFRCRAHDIYVKNNFLGNTLVRDIKEDKSREISTEIGEKTVFDYDFIPNCALFRRECLEEYTWDSHYKIEKEHIDFYLNLKMNSSWKFALTEEVTFGHYPGGAVEFESNRNDQEKHRNSERYFKDKWDIDGIAEKKHHFYDDEGLTRYLKNNLKGLMPAEVYIVAEAVILRLKK